VCAPCSRPASKQHRAFSSIHTAASTRPDATSNDSSTAVSKRQLLSGTTAAVLAAVAAPAWQQQPAQAQSLDDDFTITSSGLKVLDVRPGEGATPQAGDTVVVHWSGYTKGYQVCSMLAAIVVVTGRH
jgi:FKBP-type peptidyl-prolyl cis-trans isomerase